MPKISERRLDTLAEILECDSMCVAVACIDSKFIIAANEFHLGTQLDKGHFGVITKIMQYFKNLATNVKIDVVARNKLLKVIYEKRFSHKDLSKAKAKDEYEWDLISQFINSEKLAEGVFKSQKNDFNHNHEIRSKASKAYDEMLHIYNDLRKLEDGIIHTASGDINREITVEQLAAFKNFDPSQVILKQEGRKNDQLEGVTNKASIYSTHAEMQLLSYLIANNVQETVYLGISKKCCVNCHCMLDAANAILNEQQFALSIKHAQDHDGDFSGKWFFPDKFYNNSDPASLYSLIKKRYEEQIENFAQIYAKEKYYQHKDDSESDPSQEPTAKKKNYKDFLESEGSSYDDMIRFNRDLGVHKEFVEIGNLLNTRNLFDSFFDLTIISEDKEIEIASGNFIQQINTENFVDPEKLKIFISSPYFPKVTHKDKLCTMLKQKLQIVLDKEIQDDPLAGTTSPLVSVHSIANIKSSKDNPTEDDKSIDNAVGLKRAAEKQPENERNSQKPRSASPQRIPSP